MSDSISAETRETTALHLQSSHWLTDLLLGLGDGILLPSMWFLATWQTNLTHQQKIEIAIGLVLLQSLLHGIGIYVSSVRRDHSLYNTLTDTHNRKEDTPAADDLKIFLAKLDIPESIQAQAWTDTEAEKERWNSQLTSLQLGQSKPQKNRALQSACLVSLGYMLGGAGPISVWMNSKHLTPLIFFAVVLGMMTLVSCIKAYYTQRSFTQVVSKQLGTATLFLLFAWFLGRYLIAGLFTGG